MYANWNVRGLSGERQMAESGFSAGRIRRIDTGYRTPRKSITNIIVGFVRAQALAVVLAASW
jgi:hypothetical protein